MKENLRQSTVEIGIPIDGVKHLTEFEQAVCIVLLLVIAKEIIWCHR